MLRALMLAGICAMFACQSSTDLPVSFVTGLRVLGARADPPQVDPGGRATVALLVADTTGRAATASWTRCLEPPLPGAAVNPDCVTRQTAPFLQALGDGLTITADMPELAPGALGLPDVTNGVYLPLVARVTDGADTVVAVYRLRLGDGSPANRNPAIAEVDVVEADGVAAPLDAASPRVVHAGDALALEVAFAPGSVETYAGPGGLTATEVLTTSWFSTAGALSFEQTSVTQPQTVLRLADQPPSPGQTIDLYAVTRDGRGGIDFVHRALELQ
jgi:hypothetical protein